MKEKDFDLGQASKAKLELNKLTSNILVGWTTCLYFYYPTLQCLCVAGDRATPVNRVCVLSPYGVLRTVTVWYAMDYDSALTTR